MTQNYTKFEDELTGHFKVVMRNLTNFDPSTWKSQKFLFPVGSFWARNILLQLKNYRGVIFQETEEGRKIWRGIDSSFQSCHKVYFVWAKKVQSSYLSWNWREIQNLERNQVTVSKLARGIWQIFGWALKSLKDFNFNALVLSICC